MRFGSGFSGVFFRNAHEVTIITQTLKILHPKILNPTGGIGSTQTGCAETKVGPPTAILAPVLERAPNGRDITPSYRRPTLCMSATDYSEWLKNL